MGTGGQCFHCGSDVGASVRTLEVHGERRPVCCAGCEAAAGLILSQGLERFYEFRDPAGATTATGLRDWTGFDRDASLKRYTHVRNDGWREVSVGIDGLHCAACAWLIQTSLERLGGVADVQINASAGQAALAFDPRHQRLSGVLARIQAIGFSPHPLGFAAGEDGWKAERDVALKRLAVAGFGMMAVMTYAASLYAGAADGIARSMSDLLRYASMVVATPVVLYAAQPFFIGAWRSLRNRRFGMDVPVALSIGAAYAWSLVTTFLGHGEVYFDSAVMFTFFLLLGRFIERSLHFRAGMHHEALARLLPDLAHRLAPDGLQTVLPDELLVGDRVRVLPGERVPADGELCFGETDFDESLLTGESAPRKRRVGEAVIAGTVNVGSAVELRVTRVGQDSTLAAVSRLLERAAAARPAIATLADRIAGWFVAGILLLAVGVGIYWWLHEAGKAFPAMLAVLVVTCPCALSLATPVALAAATTRLARSGLLVSRTRAIERLARADRIVFDKTGTLTAGHPVITEMALLRAGRGERECRDLAGALEQYSEHPIARAFEHTGAYVVTDVENIVGQGVGARIDGKAYRIGRAAFAGALSGAGPAGESADQSAVWLGDEHGLLARFVLSDALRDGAGAALRALRADGLRTFMASGDRRAVAEALAARLGDIEVRAELSAADKLAWVRELQHEGHVVAMVGDGVNDAPVLAGADVSIAVGGATELARVSADLILMSPSLEPVAESIDVSRRTLGVIRQNLLWAVLYNATAIPLAAGGLLQPWMAAVGMSSSSLLVVLNALRLLRRPRSAAPQCPPVRIGRTAAA